MDAEVLRSPAWELLRRSLSRGRLAHGYLFFGDDGEALEDAATALARTLNCLAPDGRGPDGTATAACGACVNCRRIGARNHPDVTWVRPENRSRQITADQAREVVRVLTLKPMEAARKMAVFSAADRMHVTAANVFLKTLEEPPPGCVIVLLSTEPARLLETVVSRCQRVNFGVGPFRADEEVARWVAAFARDAAAGAAGVLARYRLLDALLKSLAAARETIGERLAAASPLARYPDAEPAHRERWEDELAAAVEADYRRRRGDFLGALQAWLRDVWLRASGAAAELSMLPALHDATAAVAARLRPDEALANLESWESTLRLLHTNVQEALALEVGLLRLRL